MSNEKAIYAIKVAIDTINKCFDKETFVSIRVILNDLSEALKELEEEK